MVSCLAIDGADLVEVVQVTQHLITLAQEEPRWNAVSMLMSRRRATLDVAVLWSSQSLVMEDSARHFVLRYAAVRIKTSCSLCHRLAGQQASSEELTAYERATSD